MTNREAVKAELQNIVATDNAVEKALIDYALDGNAVYSPSSGSAVARCTIQVLQAMLGSLDISEGGFSITMRSTVIPSRISALAKKWGFADIIGQTTPQIRVSHIW